MKIVKIITKIKLILLFSIILTGSVFAQNKSKLSIDELETINSYIYNELSKNNTFEFKKISTKGELFACSIEFSIAFRDYKSLHGGVIVANGSINHNYVNNKDNGYLVKLVVKSIDPNSMAVEIKKVYYLDFKMDKINFKNLVILDTESDFKGKIIVYGDPKFTMTSSFIESGFVNSSIMFSLSKKGIDNEINFKTYIKQNVLIKEGMQFIECSGEILEKVLADLEKIK